MTTRKQKSVTRTLAQRNDGFVNTLTGLGNAAKDKRMNVLFSGSGEGVDLTTCSALWRFNGTAKKVVTARNDAMFRKWITITNDTDNILLSELDRLDAKNKFRTACRWADVYGGGLIVMGIDDGGTFDKPLNENIRTVSFLNVFDISRVAVKTYYTDPAVEKYGKPETYTVKPATGNEFIVHESRCIRIDGEEISDLDLKANKGFADSIFNSIFTELKNVGTSSDAMARIVDEFIMGIFKMEGLADLIAGNREKELQSRLLQVDVAKSILRSVIVDKNEDFNRESASVAGLTDIYIQLWQALSAVSNVPLTVLLETSAKGMNATGEGDRTQYYDFLGSRQIDKLLRPLNLLVSLLLKQTASPSTVPLPKLTEWKIEFVPLLQMSEKEIVDMRNKQADTDDKYFQNGVLTAEEIRMARFGGLSYSAETHVEDSLDTSGAGDNPNDPSVKKSVTVNK